MTQTNTAKRELLIFLAVAYGVTFLMGILMWYGNQGSLDLSAFPNAQMMYPAAGVMLAYLVGRKNEENVPRWFYRVFILLTVVMVVCAVLSVAAPKQIAMPAGGEISVWTAVIQYILIGGSILCWVTIFASGKEARETYGLRWKNWKSSFACILLFLALYFLRVSIAYLASGEIQMLADIAVNPYTWIYILSMPVNFFLVFAAFFGEEYGWRYYLQPLLQKRFGLRKGVLLLGIVWGLWHLPVDFFYYTSPDKGLIMTASQLITCVSLAIFFAYAYSKTNNIWVPVLLHFLNNNLAPVITNTYSADVLENQDVSWAMLPSALLINGLLFGFFLLSKEFREEKTKSDIEVPGHR